MPRISVLMPVYNPEKAWLKEAVESILSQSFSDFELLILDDGSTVSIKDVLKPYGGGKMRYIKLPHQGIAKTLNEGLNQAKGEYIARMDADDISLPDRFKLQVDFLDNNPNCSIVGGFVQTFGATTEIWQYPKQLKYLDLLKGCLMAHPTVMFRRADFERYHLRYNPNIVAEDYELWSRAIKVLNFNNIQRVLLKYRIHQTNLSLNPKIKEADEIIRQDMLNFLTNNENIKSQIKKSLHIGKDLPSNKLAEKIFSIKNSKNKENKIICILGVKIKFKRKHKKNEIDNSPPPCILH